MSDVKGFKSSQQRELPALHTALTFCENFTLAVDGGAHVGGWTDIIAGRFDTALAFEPAPDTYARLQANMAKHANVRLYNLALMDRQRLAAIVPKKGNSPGRQVVPKPGGDVLAIALDALNLEACGFLKLDLEGCELAALHGARKTIKRYRPFILVEMAGHGERFGVADGDVHRWLKRLGYKEVFRSGVDSGFAP